MVFEMIYLRTDGYLSTSDGVVVDGQRSGNWDVYSACDCNEEFGARYYILWGEKNLKQALKHATVWGAKVGLGKIYIIGDLTPKECVEICLENTGKG